MFNVLYRLTCIFFYPYNFDIFVYAYQVHVIFRVVSCFLSYFSYFFCVVSVSCLELPSLPVCMFVWMYVCMYIIHIKASMYMHACTYVSMYQISCLCFIFKAGSVIQLNMYLSNIHIIIWSSNLFTKFDSTILWHTFSFGNSTEWLYNAWASCVFRGFWS